MLRLPLAVAVLLTGGCIASMAGQRSAADCAIAELNSAATSKHSAAAPTQLDYLVLASMADAQAMLAIHDYHPSQQVSSSEQDFSDAREPAPLESLPAAQDTL